MATLIDYIEAQQALEKEAKELMPYDPKECTFSIGPLRQDLYACLSCYRKTGQLNSVCYACSIKCHASHDLVELFTKRNRTCDCGTTRVDGPCFVRYPKWNNLDVKDYSPDIPDSSNKYSHNFEGRFCECDMPYNPLSDSNMIQCTLGVACDEDWYHEECIMGYTPTTVDRRPTGNGVDKLNDLDEPGMDAESDLRNKTVEKNESTISDDEISGNLLPLEGFPSLETFETIICWKCYNKCPEVKVIESLLECDFVEHIPNRQMQGSEEPLRKKLKGDYTKTIFLKSNYKEKLKAYMNDNPETKLGKFLMKYPFLYEEDPVYRPELDEDDTSSVFELGVQKLNSVPADQAAKGLAAYSQIKSKLTEFLKPFAETGKIVTEDEVKAFFTNIKKS